MEHQSEKSKHQEYPTWTPEHSIGRPKPVGFAKFIWNSETNEFLGRTALSWFKITVFYIFFYAGLSLFFLTSFKIFATINIVDEHPRWILDESLIGTNPGIGYRPMPDQETNVESTLIWINRDDQVAESAWFWTNELKRFLKDYSESTGGEHCDYDSPANSNTSCIVNVEKMLGCNHTNNFGYISGPGSENRVKPCVLIKLNRIYDWNPLPYSTMEDMKLAEDRKMPPHLQDHIKNLINLSEGNDVNAANELQTVWISCEGENPADIENIGSRRYFSPGMDREFPGIPNYYFPYLQQPGYMSPFVFVQFENPQLHTLINIRCKAWAKNIVAETLDRKGLVHFEFLID